MNKIYNECRKAVSVIVPVHNEQSGVKASIQQIIEAMEKSLLKYEILVIDDGSTDETCKEIMDCRGIRVAITDKTTEPKIKVLSHPYNKGYGAALKTGIANASYDYVAITDGDGTYPNEMIPQLLKEIDDVDMVVGARTGDNAQIPLARKPAKWMLGKLANYLTDFKIPDLNSGLRVIRKDSLVRFNKILPDGFSFTATITLAMLTNGNLIKYIPINYHKRKGSSKIRPIKDTLNFAQLIIRTVLYFNPLKIFIPLSALLVISAFLLLFLSWLLAGRIMDVGTGILLMSALIVMAIGMLADLIDKRMP